MENDNIFVFDTETTGLLKSKGGVIDETALEQYPYATQISAMVYSLKTGKILQVLNTYIKKPHDVLIEPEASRITGITDAMCEEKGENIVNVLTLLFNMYISCRMIVAHNYEFDCTLLRIECLRNRKFLPPYVMGMFDDDLHKILKMQVYCTMKENTELCRLPFMTKTGNLYRKVNQYKFPRLSELYRVLFGFSLPDNLHNSAVDIITCLRCFMKTSQDKVIQDEDFNQLLQECLKEGRELPKEDCIAFRTRRRQQQQEQPQQKCVVGY